MFVTYYSSDTYVIVAQPLLFALQQKNRYLHKKM
jgi:hypothetical protein